MKKIVLLFCVVLFSVVCKAQENQVQYPFPLKIIVCTYNGTHVSYKNISEVLNSDTSAVGFPYLDGFGDYLVYGNKYFKDPLDNGIKEFNSYYQNLYTSNGNFIYPFVPSRSEVIAMVDTLMSKSSANSAISAMQSQITAIPTNTTGLTEGSNLYYTSSRFNTAFAGKNTDNLSEGLANLYYTSARFNTSFSGKNTDNLTEGSTNKYFTNIRSRLSLSITTTGAGVATYDNTTGVLNIPTPVSTSMGAPTSGGGITGGTAFQPNTVSDCFVDIIATQGGALSLIGTVTVATCSTSGGTYLTRSVESLSLAVLGTNANRSITGIAVPKGYYVKVTYSGTGAGNLSSTYIQTAK